VRRALRFADVCSVALSLSVIGALLFQTACTGSQLAAVAKAEAGLETACNVTSTIVIQAQAAGLVSTADATVILNGVLQIEQANGQAITATVALNALTGANQATLLADLQPISTAISNLVANGTLNIKDPTTKANVQLALVAIQTAFTATTTILKAVK
jgi:hypothetical protein